MSDSRADEVRYAAERVMEPILRRWFAIDLEPVNLWSNAENAAVDLSYALEDAGLLLPIQLVINGVSADLKCSCENPKPHDCADRTAFTHGLELLDDPAVLARADDVRDAIAADHRVVIGPDGVEGRLQSAGESQ